VDQKTMQEVAGGVRAILDVMRQKAPAATIIVTGITPRRDRGMSPTIDAINGELASFADGRRVRYINVNARLTGSDGALLDGVTVDGLHLSVTGYQIWADALTPIFTEILGPPAAIDHAPPPTGDPSAK
jgi:lysophospholipase L1-like esterase